MKPIVKSKKAVRHKVRIVKGKAHKGGKKYDSWMHYEYDANGNDIHYKNTANKGYEHWYEYDSEGHMIHTKSSNGDEYWLKYDVHGHPINVKDSHGVETRHNYTYKKIKGKYLVEWDLYT